MFHLVKKLTLWQKYWNDFESDYVLGLSHYLLLTTQISNTSYTSLISSEVIMYYALVIVMIFIVDRLIFHSLQSIL